MRKVCLFATHHEFQFDVPMDSNFHTHLKELITDHKVDFILEEATGLPPKACVELLADELGIPWVNMDLSREERKAIPDSAINGRYDTLQDITLHSRRESAWVAKISEKVVNSGLAIVGICHVVSVGEKLSASGFQVEAHVYNPNRIFDWSGRRRIAAAQITPK